MFIYSVNNHVDSVVEKFTFHINNTPETQPHTKCFISKDHVTRSCAHIQQMCVLYWSTHHRLGDRILVTDISTDVPRRASKESKTLIIHLNYWLKWHEFIHLIFSRWIVTIGLWRHAWTQSRDTASLTRALNSLCQTPTGVRASRVWSPHHVGKSFVNREGRLLWAP